MRAPLIAIASCMLLVSSCQTAKPVDSEAGRCHVATTLAPDGSAPPCPEPTERDEVARAAAMELLGTEGFAGLWYEAAGTELVLGYVGDEPDLAQLPGVDRLVARTSSLAELEAEAATRNATGDERLFWRVDVTRGVVEAIPNRADAPGTKSGPEL